MKKYEKVAKTPYQRVLENEYVSEEAKAKLRAEHALLNPLVMKKEIDRLRAILYDAQRKHGSQNNRRIWARFGHLLFVSIAPYLRATVDK